MTVNNAFLNYDNETNLWGCNIIAHLLPLSFLKTFYLSTVETICLSNIQHVVLESELPSGTFVQHEQMRVNERIRTF